MIVFQCDSFELDLTPYQINLKEENPIFTDNIKNGFTVPFVIKLTSSVKEKLGLPNLDGIFNLDTKIKGVLRLPNVPRKATLYLGQKSADNLECKIVVGNNQLAVYDTALSELPWPLVLTEDITVLAAQQITRSFPQAGYNFPMVFNEEITQDETYAEFKSFVNHYENGAFLNNYIDNTGSEPIYVNQNVMVPFPYLLEIVRFGFEREGLTAVGEVMEDEILKTALYIPENFLEKFDNSQFLAFSFDQPTETQVFSNGNFYRYEQLFTPQSPGTYKLKIQVNFDPVVARYFVLKIMRQDALTGERTDIQNYLSVDNRVNIDEELTLNVESANNYDPFVVELQIRETTFDIEPHNSFEFSFEDGLINEFPNTFSLSSFMPDMTFGEYLVLLKNWLNIEIKPQGNVVVLNFLQDHVLHKPKEDHSHLEIVDVKITENSNRFYKLSYANNEKVFYSRDGQVYSDLDTEGNDVKNIKLDLQTAIVEQRKNVTTAIAPVERSQLDVCLFNGVYNTRPVCSPEIADNLKLQKVVDRHWLNWLKFRVLGKTYIESFKCDIHEFYEIENLSYKYGQLHIIKELGKKYLSPTTIEVEIESETF